jgi:flagella basal body P-ring formation protein FlgA
MKGLNMKSTRFIALIALISLAAAFPAFATDGVWGAENIRQAVRAYMAGSGKPLVGTAAIGPLDERMQILACATDPTITPRSAYSSSLVVHCAGPQAWTFNVRVDAEATAPVAASGKALVNGPVQRWHVVVPRASLPVGTILTAAMIEERETDIAPGGAFLKSMDEAIGLRLTAALGPGIAITTRNVARAPTIMKGETVTLTAEGEGFVIATPGRAEEDGYEGDLVAVKNIKSGIVLSGRVAQGGVVLVR